MRIFGLFLVVFLISLSAYSANDTAPFWRGDVPGGAELERWEWVKNHIELLATSDRAGVDKILFHDANSQYHSTSNYDLRIADVPNSADAFNKVEVRKKDHYSLLISFDAEQKVISVEVRLIRIPVSYSMSKKAR